MSKQKNEMSKQEWEFKEKRDFLLRSFISLYIQEKQNGDTLDIEEIKEKSEDIVEWVFKSYGDGNKEDIRPL